MSKTPSPAQTNPVSSVATAVANPVPSSRLDLSNEQSVITPPSLLRREHQPLPSAHPVPEPTAQIPQSSRLSGIETTMARRYPTTGGRAPRPSSPSSDSQGGMADSEMEQVPADHSQQSENAPPSISPPKKKRTRTLTTPHQSEVLHALLAQSRFPSTAVREEVGRAIGLSARKVQIWFQNQRQKAKRPRSRSAQPSSRAGQYGPPLTTSRAPDRPSLTTSPIASTSQAGSSGMLVPARPQSPGMPHAPGGNGTGPPLRLSGPGIPGFDSRMPTHILSEGEDRPPRRSFDPRSPRFGPYPDYGTRHPASSPLRAFRSPPPPSAYPGGSVESFPSRSALRHVHDPSRTLPPLVFNPPRRNTMPAPGRLESYPPLSSSYGTSGYDSSPTLLSPISPYSQRPFGSVARETIEPSSSRSDSYTTLPPPSSFRPPPHWEPTSWHPDRDQRYVDSLPRASSPDEQILFRPLGRLPTPTRGPADSGDGSRAGGRYDPVRGVVLPYSNPSSPAREGPSRAASPQL